MKVIRSVAEIRAQSLGHAGFVPTMGALHQGHLHLMQRAKEATGSAVVSIFVNPLQFGPTEDFQKYPRALERDLRLCEETGVDVVFAPEAGEIYPAGFETVVDVGRLGEVLEGKSRPGHFRGVATVVLKLLNLVRPRRAFFGQKDFQQTVVLRRMVEDLAVPCELEVVPTVREADGLAMSSRNVYLSPAERAEAPVLHQALSRLVERLREGERSTEALVEEGRRVIGSSGLAQLEYLEIVSEDRLERLVKIDRPAVALLVARFGKTRLLDNTRLSVEGC